MDIRVEHREQPAEEIEVWERWCRFTDACRVAPDTVRDAEALSNRYFRETGKLASAKSIEALMPENHPNYPWNRVS